MVSSRSQRIYLLINSSTESRLVSSHISKRIGSDWHIMRPVTNCVTFAIPVSLEVERGTGWSIHWARKLPGFRKACLRTTKMYIYGFSTTIHAGLIHHGWVGNNAVRHYYKRIETCAIRSTA
jgi:hypothetical protein